MGIITFEGAFEAHKQKFDSVRLNDSDVHNCVLYMKRVYKRDQKIKKLNQDNKTKYREMFESTCAVTAISKTIGFPILDYSNIKESPIEQFRSEFGKYFDVIIFNHGEFPIFYYKMYKKAIFVCKMSDTNYVVCGFATPYVINSYHSKKLIVNQTIREQSNMSAFYGLEYLKKLPKNIYDFKLLIN